MITSSRLATNLRSHHVPHHYNARHFSQITTMGGIPITTAESDILGTEDVIIGTAMAIILALLASFLQGRRNQADADIVLWPSPEDETNSTSSENSYFGADGWEEMSRPENYILYNSRIRQQKVKQESLPKSDVVRKEKRGVLIALLVLFVPIFSFEFFLALSRQIICGDAIVQSEFTQELCSAHISK